MKVLAVLSVLLFAVMANAAYVTERQYQREFSRFVKTYAKKYTTDDFFGRYEIFKANLDIIELHNSQAGSTSTIGVNAFADMTSAEFAAKMNGYTPAVKKNNRKVVKPKAVLKDYPASMDWRTKGAVTPVKDQGQCGSCWSFSATGSMEGAWFLAKGNLTSLSEQQLMDCSHPEGDDSCEGGLMDDAFQYVIDNKGICTEASYPYKAVDEKCKTGCTKVATISSFQDVFYDESNPTNETALMAAIQLGPVSIAIEADQPIFQLYTGGVISGKSCGTNLDHGVLIVGYDTDAKLGDYWIVKNSWGQAWGIESGYVRLARNQNECGLNSAASYPVV
jgi:cathepsin L